MRQVAARAGALAVGQGRGGRDCLPPSLDGNMLEPRIVDDKGHFVGIAFGELRPMTVAFGMVVFAVALIAIEIFVQDTAVGGDRPGLGHGSATVALEAQSASLEVNL